mmetsp:Transcript_16815/g.26699  ORF Transcript_16815/g.26699 Transcript_16815/m.26699 type:complete len:113 (-) Transcript_16815:1278-1616(-)
MVPNIVVFTTYGDIGRVIIIYKNHTSNKSSTSPCLVNVVNQTTQTVYLKYLMAFTKIGSFGKSINISFKKGFPVKIYSLIESHGSIRLYLAPKVNESKLNKKTFLQKTITSL